MNLMQVVDGVAADGFKRHIAQVVLHLMSVFGCGFKIDTQSHKQINKPFVSGIYVAGNT